MKKALQIIIVLCLGLMFTFTLTGCLANTELNQLQRIFDTTVDTSSNFDNIASEDLTEQNINGIRNTVASIDEPRMVFLADDLTVDEKIQQVLELHRALVDKQAYINSKRLELKDKINELKTNIRRFKDAGLKLTDEEKTQLKAYIVEAKEINTDIKGTIGKIYRPLFNLRGHYQKSNIDNILLTFMSANEQMDIRVNGCKHLLEIVNNINTLIVSKIG